MKHYLSGPMSGLPSLNFPAFEAAAQVLRAMGVDLLSAHEIPHDEPAGQIGTLPWSVYLRTDLKHLLECDALILLPGWPASRGAQVELGVALALGMPVAFFAPETGELISMQRWSDEGGIS